MPKPPVPHMFRRHSLIRTTVLPMDPDSVWRTIGRFAGLADWHPTVPPSVMEEGDDPEMPGTVRAFLLDGAVVARERLLARDDSARAFRYTVFDTPLPITDYEATLTVVAHDQGAEVRWSAIYNGADETVPEVERLFGDVVYASGLAALRARFTTPPEAE
ncbi:SRPBCC family protein [Streptomyces sp. NPDC048196]|uniref:SRPBCC family protein n=1 Tax=Streptomyces sp. NPDC048196 TaxID=3154712 RepID=UPI0033E115E6